MTSHTSRPEYTDAYRAWVLTVLFVIYMLNYIDRALLNIVGQAVKEDLGLSDLQLGLAAGLAFAIVNGIMSIPVARLAEYHSRAAIITIALGFWSVMTALCGLAQNFWQLALARAGVGIGEAGGVAPSQSLIADYFPADRRAMAAAIFGTATPVGMLVGALSAGWITEHFSWRTAFLVAGLPGIGIAILAAMSISDPPRGHSDGLVLQGAPPSFGAALRRVASLPAFRHMLLGGTILNFAFFGYITFLHPFMFRSMGMGYTQAATFYGLVTGIAAGIGYLVGGFVADGLGRRDRRWYLWVPCIGSLVAAPAFTLGFIQTDWAVAAAFFLVGGIGGTTWYGPTMSVVHRLVEPRMRATAVAIAAFVMLIFGVAMGPAFVGLLSDLFGSYLAHNACPTQLLCDSTGAGGLRPALILICPLYIWAAAHYAIAANHLGVAQTQAKTTDRQERLPYAAADERS